MHCRVVEIDSFDDERWGNFVLNHPSGWVCHLSSWKKILEETFSHIHGHYLAIIDEGNSSIVAALPLFEVKSWILGQRFVSIPYATLSDPLIGNADELNLFLNYIYENLYSNKDSYLGITIYNTDHIFKQFEINTCSKYVNHYLLLDSAPDVLLRKNFKDPIRRSIKKVSKENIDIFEAVDDQHVSVFYNIYVETRRRLGLPPQPFRFFLNLFNILSKRGQISIQLAKRGEEIIGAIILLKYKDRVSVDYLASDIKYREIGIDTFLWWEAIKYSWREGYRIFDFGRTSIHNTGLLTYKDRWGAIRKNISHYSNEKDQNFDKDSSFLYKPIKTICLHAPRPIFQYIGKLIYNHIG